MHTKERFHITVRVLCFVILLAAVGFRLAYELHGSDATEALRPQLMAAEPDFPSLRYQPAEKTQAPEVFAFDASLVPILNWSGTSVDAEALIQAPLEFALTQEPMILIVHTHATEAYCNTDGYRTSDTTQNVVRIGQEMAQCLNDKGICTLHDTTLIDQSGYYDSYARAAEIIEEYLQKYPSIQMVIDVHRDSVTDANGAQVALTTQLEEQTAAQLMLVMGTDTGGMEHPNWTKNLSFALKLQSLCEQEVSGIFRDLNLRSQRYNQHLTPNSILVEVGSAGNALSQALTSANIFADVLSKLLLSQGT